VAFDCDQTKQLHFRSELATLMTHSWWRFTWNDPSQACAFEQAEGRRVECSHFNLVALKPAQSSFMRHKHRLRFAPLHLIIRIPPF